MTRKDALNVLAQVIYDTQYTFSKDHILAALSALTSPAAAPVAAPAACGTCGGTKGACHHCYPKPCDCDGQPPPDSYPCPDCNGTGKYYTSSYGKLREWQCHCGAASKITDPSPPVDLVDLGDGGFAMWYARNASDHKDFCDNYRQCWNAAQAAIRALPGVGK